MGVATVGRPRKRLDKNGEPAKWPAVVFKGPPEFMEWVEGFAASQGLDKSKLIELALVELARARRHPRTPPPRLG